MRGSFGLILWSILVLDLFGCTHLRGDPVHPVVDRFGSGIAAWQDGDHLAATLHLSQQATTNPDHQLRERAKLFLTALHLDPRNETYDPGEGAALAAELIHEPRVSDSNAVLGEVFYLLARELGAATPPDTSRLPRLPGTPLASRLDRLQAEYDQQQREISRLRRELREKSEEIERLQRELERIRKTLSP